MLIITVMLSYPVFTVPFGQISNICIFARIIRIISPKPGSFCPCPACILPLRLGWQPISFIPFFIKPCYKCLRIIPGNTGHRVCICLFKSGVIPVVPGLFFPLSIQPYIRPVTFLRLRPVTGVFRKGPPLSNRDLGSLHMKPFGYPPS